jgi:hypothetical protein
MEGLGKDELLMTFGLCELRDVGALSRTCKWFNLVIMSKAGEGFWAPFVQQKLPLWAKSSVVSGWKSKDVLLELLRPFAPHETICCQAVKVKVATLYTTRRGLPKPCVVFIRLNMVFVCDLSVLTSRNMIFPLDLKNNLAGLLVGSAELRVRDWTELVRTFQVFLLNSSRKILWAEFKSRASADKLKITMDEQFLKWGREDPQPNQLVRYFNDLDCAERSLVHDAYPWRQKRR